MTGQRARRIPRIMAKPYDPKDFYFRKAKKEGFRARSKQRAGDVHPE